MQLQLFSFDNHGQRITAPVEVFKSSADIVIEFLHFGHNDTVSAHYGDDLGKEYWHYREKEYRLFSRMYLK